MNTRNSEPTPTSWLRFSTVAGGWRWIEPRSAIPRLGLWVALALPWCFPLWIPAAHAQVVRIPDPELQQAIRRALDKAAGDLTVADMEGLTELDASSTTRGGMSRPLIQSLEGLQTAKNLVRLDLGGYYWRGSNYPNLSTRDLSPLSSLTHLQTLDLSWNQITSLTLAEGLSSLQTLDLRGNGLTSLTLPEGLSSLQTLDLWGNRLTDFDFLSGLSSLQTLDLGDNDLWSLTLPEGLSSLQTLSLYYNRLTSLTLPEGLSTLQTLDLGDNGLTSLTLPEGLSSLQTLSLYYNRLTSLTLPEGLSTLQTLDLGDNGLTSLTLPEGLSSLQTLDLSGNVSGNRFLTSLTLPEGLSSLQALDLSYNRLTRLTLPEGLSSLQTMDLAYNRLTRLTVPWQLAKLTYLNVTDNPLAELKVYETIFGRLQVDGFPRNWITVLPADLRFGPPFVANDGGIRLPLSGPSGWPVRVQRSTNLVDWEDWKTVTFEGAAVVLADDHAPGSLYFWRAIEILTDPGP